MSPAIDIVDDTLVVAAPAVVAGHFTDPSRWGEWWPGLRLRLDEDRALEGLRWTVSGELTGSAEIWLEPWHDGVIVHWYLRAEPPPGTRPSVARRIRRRQTLAFKRRIHELKDRLEAGRAAGVQRAAAAG